jgi:hypothetical protein
MPESGKRPPGAGIEFRPYGVQGIKMDQDKLPLPWHRALLAMVPGLVATVGWVGTDFSAKMFAGSTLLAVFLGSAYWRNDRRLPAWSLVGAGMLASVVLTVVSGLIGGLAAMVAGASANTVVLVVLLGALAALLGTSAGERRAPPLVWVLLAVVVVCQLGVRCKYFLSFGVSWPVAGQWLTISLYAAVVALLLPVALGYRLARRYGSLATLFVIGMVYGGFQVLVDVNSKVSDQIGGTLGFAAYEALIPLMLTVAAPLWFLRARSSRSRLGGVLALSGLAVMIDLVVVGWSYRGELPPIIWISFVPYTISVLLTLTSAHLLYEKRASASC